MALFEPTQSRREISSQLVWFAAWVAATCIGLYLTPSAAGHGTHEQLGLPPCPSVLIFDRPCPGCGLTTSWTALLHGQWAFAFHAHPLGPPLYLIFTISAIAGLVAWFKRTRIDTTSPRWNRAFSIGVAVFVIFGVVRMALSPGIATPQEQFFGRVIRP